LLTLSRILFLVGFAGYLVSAITFIARITSQRAKPAPAGAAVANASHLTVDRPARIAGYVMMGAVAVHGIAMVLRWIASGQAPMSNMYEYMSLTGWAAMLFFVVLNFRYNVPALGAFAAPVGVFVLAYGSVFPSTVQPLVPALQSYWLVLHVTVAALGEGAFAVSFAAALMYLLRIRRDNALSRLEESALETVFGAGAMLAGFLGTALTFRAIGYEVIVPNGDGAREIIYHLPPFAAPPGMAHGSLTSFLGLPLPLFNTPEWMAGFEAARKFNTLAVALVTGFVIYWVIRLIAGRSLRELFSGAVANLDPDILDDISYRGIAMGFPLFTLGGLVFAMIWAQKAWGSYWSWDPKETWSLISWLFYSGYLHLRIVKGWEGRPAAWTAAIGFVVIIFTLVGVNLLISGLHSYAAG